MRLARLLGQGDGSVSNESDGDEQAVFGCFPVWTFQMVPDSSWRKLWAPSCPPSGSRRRTGVCGGVEEVTGRFLLQP